MESQQHFSSMVLRNHTQSKALMESAPINLTFEKSESPFEVKLEIIKEEPTNPKEEPEKEDGVLSPFDLSTKDQIPNDGTLDLGGTIEETKRRKSRLVRSIFELSPRTPQLL